MPTEELTREIEAAEMPQKLQSRTHRERAQPASRSRLGLLEKHADYVARARSHHSKVDRLKWLAVRARERNPDEFYFGMISGARITSAGVHRKVAKRIRMDDLVDEEGRRRRVEETSGPMDTDVVQMLKGQDLSYLHMLRSVNRAKLAGPTCSAAADGDDALRGEGKQHVRFVEDAQEGLQLVRSLVSAAPTSLALASTDPRGAGRERQERVRKLDIAIRQLEVQRSAMGKGRKRKVGVDADRVPIYKYAMERKK